MKRRKAVIKVGMIVIIRDSSGRYGQVKEIFDHWRPKEQGEPRLYHVHYIDSQTGRLMVCPDEARCKNEHTCPIHGSNCWAEQIEQLPERDIKFFVEEGLLAKELVGTA